MIQALFRIFLYCLALTAGNGLYAQHVAASTTPAQLKLVENQGQWHPGLRYAADLSGGHLLLENQGFVYNFYSLPAHAHPDREHQHHATDNTVRGHAFRMRLAGANPQPEIVPAQRHSHYHNYFIGNDPGRWRGRVPLFGAVTYKSVYPGIDLTVYENEGNLKYDFIVHPGADYSQIRMEYEGLESISLKQGELHFSTSVRQVVEQRPYAYYQTPAETKGSNVACEFVLKDNAVSFRFPKTPDPGQTLVIDPTLIFSTYTGAQADNWGFTATYDTLGNLYAGGIIYMANMGPSGYPVTLGAYQTVYRGGSTEAVISKFNPAGTALAYSTYLGGGDVDQPHSLVVNERNELFVYGRTNSSNFPTTLGAYDRSINGDYDIFVARFDSSGSRLLASTFVGGSASDGENGFYFARGAGNTALQYNYGDDARGEIILDGQGGVLVAACSKSVNFPTTAGALQRTIGGGGQDGVVFRMNEALSQLSWSTFLGGSGLDAAYGIKADGQGNVYVTGGTTSNNFPTTAGAWRRTYQGNPADGFVAKLNANASQILSCTYVGTNDYDQCYFIELDRNLNVYVTGQTRGSFPVIGTVYNNPGAPQFIVKFDNSLGNVVYSTVFGSTNTRNPNISPTAFLVDRCENVYVAGWGGITNNNGDTRGMPTTNDAIQRSTDGSDFYIIVLERDARNILYGTYMGGFSTSSGEHVDGGTCRFDRNGIIYHAVCAGCGGNSSFPTTPGVVSRTNNSGNCNMAAFKIQLDLSGVKASFRPLDLNNQPLQFKGCAPLPVVFDNLSNGKPGSNYYWDFGDGNTSGQFKPTHSYPTPGTYRVRLIVEDPSTCNVWDTTYGNIVVFDLPRANAGPDLIICPGDTVQLSGSTNANPAIYSWSPGGSLNQTTTPAVLAFPAADTRYLLAVIDSNNCVGVDTVQVSLDRSLLIAPRQDTVICEGASVRLTTQSNGISFNWSPAATLNNAQLLSPTARPDTTTKYYITAVNARGCEVVDSVQIAVFEVYTLEDTALCRGDTITMLTTGGVSFTWAPNNALSNPNSASPQIWPRQNITYTVTATSDVGCISRKSVAVLVRDLPPADAGRADSICVGQSTPLAASGGLLYQWSPQQFLSDPNVPNPDANPPRSTRYTVKVTDAYGCRAFDTVTVRINSLPNVAAGPSVIICPGDSIQLFATGALRYRWAPNDALDRLDVSDPFAKPVEINTLFTVTGIDENGCEDDTSFVVQLGTRPEVEIEGQNFRCVGGDVRLRAIGGQRVLWSTGDTSHIIRVNPALNTTVTYYVTAFNGLCEGETDSVTVDRRFRFPVAAFNPDSLTGWAPQTVQFTNLSEGAVEYIWDFGYGNQGSVRTDPSHIFPRKGEYTVRLIAINSTGCADTTYGRIYIDNVAIHVPSAFSPNRDGINDYFQVGYFGMRDLKVQIYSRWGMLIYEDNLLDFQWDGTYRGADVPEGVYVWVIRSTGLNNLNFEQKGTVTVIR